MLIGLHGPARSGKDEAANFLVAEHGFWRESFAKPLKRCVCALLDTGMSWLENFKDVPSPALNGHTPRDLLQQLGTEFFRAKYGEDFWVNLMRTRLRPDRDTVITDLRFENEAALVRQCGGIVVHVSRKWNQHAIATADHVSERPLEFNRDRDACLVNPGVTLTGYHLVIETLLRTLQDRSAA